MIPTPGGQNDEGGQIIRNLLAEFLGGFSLRTLVFLLDMVLPQLDAYHSGRQMQHLQPCVSVALVQEQTQGQQGIQLPFRYQYEAYAGFHVITLATEGTPLLLFGDPSALPHVPRGISVRLAILVAWNPMLWLDEHCWGVCNCQMGSTGMPFSSCWIRPCKGIISLLPTEHFGALHRNQLNSCSCPTMWPARSVDAW
jgi:hypothetical protein